MTIFFFFVLMVLPADIILAVIHVLNYYIPKDKQDDLVDGRITA